MIFRSDPIPTLEAERSRYQNRRWLNPPDVAEELAEYVAEHGKLPDEWLDVIREEQRNGKTEV